MKPINDRGQVVEDGHTFRIDSDGDVNCWVIDRDYHNGPWCTSCDEGFCEHCNRDVFTEKCDEVQDVLF